MVCLPHIVYWIFEFQWTEIREYGIWEIPSGCANFTYTSPRIIYSMGPEEYQNETLLLVEGIFFTLIPSIILPIVTIVLIYFLKTMKRSTASNNNNHNARSTKMVALVTVTFLLATVPLGITYLYQHTDFSFGIRLDLEIYVVQFQI